MKLSSTLLRRAVFAVSAFLLFFTGNAQPHQMEALDRGVVAVRKNSSEVYIGWRLLGSDPSGIAFNLYREAGGGPAIKLTATPLEEFTNFVDSGADLGVSNAYYVRPVIDGVEHAPSSAYELTANAPEQQYLSIPLQKPADVNELDEEGNVINSYTYSANDTSVGDLDGDGAYEIIVKWDPSNSKDNSQSGHTGNVYLDAYKMDGTLLWRIDLGINIRAGAHYTQFMVYDLDGDGKAEVAAKTADGTTDGVGNVLGDPNVDYRNADGYILAGPEYLSLFDGETGEFLVTTDYVVPRHPDTENPTSEQLDELWGDGYGNRLDRFLACVAYLDGERPSLVMARGYYTRTVLVAFDWRDGELTQRWLFDTNPDGGPTVYPEYRGQGAHSLTVGDVDGDGRDEIVYGASTIDDDGTGLYSTGLGHGDALHLSDMVPSRPGQEIWMVHEGPSSYGAHGAELHDAATGEILFSVGGEGGDVGRGLAADIDPNYRGFEVWASRGGLNNVGGESLGAAGVPPINFAVWWDADLLREILDGTTVSKWNWQTKETEPILSPTGVSSNNGTKANPALSADILGDWREEIILRASDSSELRLFTTTIPASNRLFTLMHDRQYRLAIAWQNVGYNQPPHTSFFLGHDMEQPERPDMYLTDGNEAPQVELTSPENEALYPEGEDIPLAAEASDSDGEIKSVSFYVGDSFFGTDITDPYSALWQDPVGGSYEVFAVATDDDTKQGTSETIVAHVTHNDLYDESVAVASGATLHGDVPGYHGQGFYMFSPGPSYIEFSGVDGGLGGEVTLRLRYSFDRPGTHPAKLFVNGVERDIKFASTQGDGWAYIDVQIELDAGTDNVIRLRSPFSDAFRFDEAVARGVFKNQVPTVAIVSPEDGSSFAEGLDIPIVAEAYDVGGDVVSVDFYEGDVLLSSDATTPFVYDWIDAAEGTYVFSAVATDDQGGLGTSDAISVLVNNPPTVTLTEPSDGSYFLTSDPITLVAEADDGQGSVTTVEFLLDGQPLASASESPYTYDWTGFGEGSYVLGAVATDNQGAQGESEDVGVTILSDGEQAVYPAEEALLSGGVAVASDNPGFNGTGYVDFPAEGGMVRFTRVDGGSGSLALISIRYALGSSESRVAQIQVNGFTQAVEFTPTGGWENYDVLSLPFPLDAGKSNTVEIVSTGEDAGNIDEILARGLQDDERQVYHAENGISVGGSFDSNNPGFNGFSFYNFPSEGSLEFPRVDGGQGGTASLLIRYTLGAADPRTGRVTVNGVAQEIPFTSTGSWTTYQDLAIDVELNAGIENTILLESIGSDMANVDEIAIVGIVPNELPLTRLLSPAEGASIEDFSDILLTAESTDLDGIVTNVEFYVNGALIGEDNTAPYEYLWEEARFGDYEIVAVGVDDYGAKGYSDPVSIEVFTDNLFPTASIASPASGTVFSEGDNVLIEATASDSDGVIEMVRFYAGDQLLGEDDTAPYSWAITGIEAGSYALTAVAVDDYGFETRSEEVEIGALFSTASPLAQEAEDGLLVGSYVVESDPAASGGELVNAVSGPAASNYLEMKFNIEDGGRYRIKVWIRATDGSHDSMFVSIDGATPEQYLFFTARDPSNIIEDYVSHNNEIDPLQPYLGVGGHTIRFGYRENLRIDRIALEPVPTTPGGMYLGFHYAIVNVGSGYALEIDGSAAGSLARQGEYTGADNQLFTLIDVGDGYYNISPVHSGQFLDVTGGRTNNGDQILQWTGGTAFNQHWAIAEELDGSVILTARHSGLLMSVPGDSTDLGVVLVQWEDIGSDFQRWAFVEP